MDEIFDKLFGNVFFDEFMGALEEYSAKRAENKNNENEKDSTYFHSVSSQYEDGKCVSRHEKEIKNGEVVKDVTYCSAIEDKKETKEENKDSEIVDLQRKISDKDEMIKELTEKVNKLTSANKHIRETLKSLFSEK